MPKNLLYSLLILILFFGCSPDDNSNNDADPTASGDTNILLIIADDLGLDALNGYSEGSIKPNTPNLDDLAASGLVFNNFWTNSVCSPTRSTILTGKYGFSTGVRSQGDEISSSETSLQSYINQSNEYATAIVGKWHLSGNRFSLNPEDMGIDYYAGLYSGAVSDYYNWNLTEDGVVTTQTEYATTKFTDLAIDWVAAQTKPCFLWLAYNAPHTPFHAPPAAMHSQGALATDQASINADPMPYYMASIEAAWERTYPTTAFEYVFIDEQFMENYEADQIRGQLFLGFSGMTILIACLGLLGLASYTAEQRSKEISIRKVLGAKTQGLIGLLIKDFVILIVIAAIPASVLGYLAMIGWLESFQFHITPGFTIFASVILGTIAITVLTTGYHARKAATANPAQKLRSE